MRRLWVLAAPFIVLIYPLCALLLLWACITPRTTGTKVKLVVGRIDDDGS